MSYSSGQRLLIPLPQPPHSQSRGQNPDLGVAVERRDQLDDQVLPALEKPST